MSESDNPTPAPAPDQGAAELPFLTLWYRFLFFDWLFADMRTPRNLYERHAALQHNRRMCRYMPTYLRRWSLLTCFDFGLGLLCEKALQASLLSAWFFTWTCLTFTGMVVISVAWAFLANAKP